MNEFFETYRIYEYNNAAKGLVKRNSMQIGSETLPATNERHSNSIDMTVSSPGGMHRVLSTNKLGSKAIDINGVAISIDNP